MASPARPFPFLRLPGELRNQIYEYALIVQDTIDIPNTLSLKDPSKFHVLSGDHPNIHLLATCRQIRREALSICYSANKFRQDMDDYEYPFLERLRDDSLSCLKSITFTLPFRFLDAHARNPHLREIAVWRLVNRVNDIGQLYGPRGLDIAAIHTVKFAQITPSMKLSDMRRLEWSKDPDGSWRVELRPFEELNYHLTYPNVRRMAHHHWY
ncbi:hypothetical protein HII31_05398 [Pseudocercospora fuligena]|uniref:2EXR domain-containing protein n=1 Tax=Pseudocercospora fuligena TaxID=685502 RepID=A0A8H6VM92_9PEZI|nr:hypothetical protein HII31_05398 [Pseudocercospora fuligena]